MIDERWAARIDELLARNSDLLASSVLRLLEPEGFPASYPTLVRHLREKRGARKGRGKTASMPIETFPAEEAQADWSDCRRLGHEWGLGDLWCFGAIHCWCRRRFWWFAPSIDAAHTLEGFVRFFEDSDGVPAQVRIDNMGALVTDAHPRLRLRPVALDFAGHYGFRFVGCWPGDAQRKGKIERPFRELREAFLQEMEIVGPPTSIEHLNALTAAWLTNHVHPRKHRVTGQPPDDRFAVERPLLSRLPLVRFDTARREPRRVGAVPLIEVDGGLYSVPPACVRATVEIRVPVDAGVLEVRHAGHLVASHRLLAHGETGPVWAPEHRAAAEAEAMGRHRRRPQHLRVVDDRTAVELDLGVGDWQVAPVDLDGYDLEGGTA